MKYKLIILNIIFWTQLLLGESNSPILSFNKRGYDFGKVRQNQTFQTVFYYTNKSNKKIRIKGVYSTCGCTIPMNYKKVLNPGEYGKVTVIFNSENFKGLIIRKIYFEILPPSIPYPSIEIKATVFPLFQFKPDPLIINFSSRKEEVFKNISLFSTYYKSFKIIDMEIKNKKGIKIKRISKERKNLYNIELIFFPKFIKTDKFNYFSEKIIFKLKVKNKIEKAILYIYGRIK